jgi:hypothetical protein
MIAGELQARPPNERQCKLPGAAHDVRQAPRRRSVKVIPHSRRRHADPIRNEPSTGREFPKCEPCAIGNTRETQENVDAPLAPDASVIAFGSVDERFIDYLVEEAVRGWRAKNF